MFRGVVVPAGEHVVRFDYRPVSFRIGVWLCALGLALCAALAFYSRRKPREPAPK